MMRTNQFTASRRGFVFGGMGIILGITVAGCGKKTDERGGIGLTVEQFEVQYGPAITLDLPMPGTDMTGTMNTFKVRGSLVIHNYPSDQSEQIVFKLSCRFSEPLNKLSAIEVGESFLPDDATFVSEERNVEREAVEVARIYRSQWFIDEFTTKRPLIDPEKLIIWFPTDNNYGLEYESIAVSVAFPTLT